MNKRNEETSFRLDVLGLGNIPLIAVHRFDERDHNIIKPLNKPVDDGLAATIAPNELMDRWWQAVNKADGTFGKVPASTYKKDATLRFFDAQERETRSYELKGVFPTKFQGSLDDDGRIQWDFSVDFIGSLSVLL